MEINDKELFAAAMSDEAPAEPVTDNAQQPDTDASQPRDESGRFAPKSQGEAPSEPVETAAQPSAEQGGNVGVPPGRLREESEARRRAEAEKEELRAQLARMEQQIAAMSRQPVQPQPPQQPQQVPDWYTDPDAATDHRVNPRFQQIEQMLDYNARLAATGIYSREAIDSAVEAVLTAKQTNRLDPLEEARIANAPNRYEAAVQWHKRQQVLSEVGEDPQAYRQKVLDAALDDPSFLAKAIERARQSGGQPQSGAAPVVQLPPSLNTRTAASPTHPDDATDASDAAIWKAATRR